MKQIKHLRAFKVKYLGPTNHNGSRVKITDTRFNKSITIPYDYQYNDAFEVAIAHLESIGIKLDSYSFNGDVILTSDFHNKLRKGE